MSPFLYPPPNIQQPVVIYNDGGGLVTKYMDQAYRYKMEGRRVEIRGSCRSACLLALSVPNVCVSPAAEVKAHNAYEVDTGIRRPDVTREMLAELPKQIKQRLEGKIQNQYNAAATLDYYELRSLKVPDCDTTPKVKVTASDVPEKREKPRKITIKLMNPLEAIFRLFPGAKR